MGTIMGMGYSSHVYAFHFSVCVIEGPETPWASLEITLNGNALGAIFEEGQKFKRWLSLQQHIGYIRCSHVITFSSEQWNQPEDIFIAINVNEHHFLGGCCTGRL